MKQNERTTLYVAFQHLQAHNMELADAIQGEFHYLEVQLRVAIFNVMANLHPQYATEDKEFHIALFNMPSLSCIRDLKTSKIASLVRWVHARSGRGAWGKGRPRMAPTAKARTPPPPEPAAATTCVHASRASTCLTSVPTNYGSFSGTVTRTSEVRPELLSGVFHCELCGTTSSPITQQFKYCEPVKCNNPVRAATRWPPPPPPRLVRSTVPQPCRAPRGQHADCRGHRPHRSRAPAVALTGAPARVRSRAPTARSGSCARTSPSSSIGSASASRRTPPRSPPGRCRALSTSSCAVRPLARPCLLHLLHPLRPFRTLILRGAPPRTPLLPTPAHFAPHAPMARHPSPRRPLPAAATRCHPQVRTWSGRRRATSASSLARSL